MAMKNPYAQYKKNSVMTASPQELTLMLYDGALKFLKQGIVFIEEKNIEKANHSINKTQDIITEFMATVDTSYEVGRNLYLLYDYMKNRLIDANINKDKEMIEEVYDMMKELRDTWQEAMNIVKKGK